MSDHILTGIGKRIKEIRLKSDKKLTTLAKEADISKGLLSKIENGRTVPSLPVLFSIIKTLKVAPEEFFSNIAHDLPKKIIHKSAQEFLPIKKEEEALGFNYNFILDKAFENFTIEVVLLEIEPGSNRKPVSVDAYELKYLVEGNIEYHIEDEIFFLQQGDVLLYDGKLPHVPMNKSDKPAKMLVVYFYYLSSHKTI